MGSTRTFRSRRSGVALALAVAATGALADEGLWLPEQLPDVAPRIAVLGFRGDPRALAALSTAPLGAVISLGGGCSGAFVSPDGLIATSYRCVAAALQLGSRPERDLLEDGFVARTRSEEIWVGPGSRGAVTVAMKDVTAEIASRIDPALPDAERGRLLERRVRERTGSCERRGLRCAVVPLDGGARWYEVAQLELPDLRLVFAPPRGIGALGGESEGGAWPRHAGDFALLRAWAGPDGKAGPFGPQNAPYHPPLWVPVSGRGTAEGDLVLSAGYPGETWRLADAAATRAELEWRIPRSARRAREQLQILERLSRSSRDAELRLAPRVRALADALRDHEAVLADAARRGVLARRLEAERELAAWIEADTTRRAEYGNALEQLEALGAEGQRTRERDATFAALHEGSALLSAARVVVRLAAERPRRDADRLPEFRERNWPRLREALEGMQRSLDLAADRALLRHAALEAAALPPEQRIAPLDSAIGLTPGMAAEEAVRRVDGWLDGLYSGTRLGDPARRAALAALEPAALAGERDPFLALAASLAPVEDAIREEAYARDGARARLAPRRLRALLERSGGLLAPDGNGTLRLTFGAVKGVSPRDGIRYLPRTTLAGLLARHREGDRDLGLPEAVREAIRSERARADGPWRDTALNDVPVNFLSTLDAAGASPGAPVLDGRGDLVGLLVDVTHETAAQGLLFDAEQGRAIAVDARYLLWFLSEVAGATPLLEEMGASGPPVGARLAP
jgi:hypothetical protein